MFHISAVFLYFKHSVSHIWELSISWLSKATWLSTGTESLVTLPWSSSPKTIRRVKSIMVDGMWMHLWSSWMRKLELHVPPQELWAMMYVHQHFLKHSRTFHWSVLAVAVMTVTGLPVNHALHICYICGHYVTLLNYCYVCIECTFCVSHWSAFDGQFTIISFM